MMGGRTASPEALTALDWIAVVMASLTALALLVFPWTIAPTFAAMFRDLGGPLPSLTRLFLLPWPPPALALLPCGLLTAALARRETTVGERRLWIVGAFVLGLAGCGVALFALYQPVFALAGAIGP